MSAQVLGLARTLANLARVAGGAEVAEEVAERVVSTEVAETAKSLAPVDTGALRDSIAQTSEGVVVGAPYAVFVEYGTSESPAQPFVRPAIDEAHEETAAVAVSAVVRTVA